MVLIVQFAYFSLCFCNSGFDGVLFKPTCTVKKIFFVPVSEMVLWLPTSELNNHTVNTT